MTVGPAEAGELIDRLVAGRPASWIDGAWSAGQGSFDVHAPATGARLATVGNATSTEARAAVRAARTALPAWSATPAWQRFEVLRRAVDLLRERTEEIAELICLETGKPHAEARGEAANTARFVEWFAHETLRLPGQAWPDVTADRDALVLCEPVGVVVAITPWNFPAFLVACKVGAALAAGCSVVLKPAPQTPLTALALARVFTDAGLPAGVLNVVTVDDPERVGALLDSPEVACISLTGSRRAGEEVMRRAAQGVKRVLLELGGNSPAIVLPDADVERTARELVRARFLNNGQACMAANRVYVVEPAEQLIDALLRRVRELTVGDPFDPATRMGPLIDHAAVSRLEGQVRQAVDQGATISTGGGRAAENHVSAYVEPTVLTADAATQPEALREELFGPVLSILRCRDVDEAIEQANATEYGLAGYVFSADHATALRVARRLETGSVAINCALVSEPALPFGGRKGSGLGRERGRAGVEEYLETKTIHIATS